MTNPEDFSSNEVNASMQVYPFRPFTGNFQQAFGQTGAREQKFQVNLWGGVGSGTFTPAPNFFLISADGRVYRTFDPLKLPTNGPGGFDFATAAREDPENTGRFSVQGTQLLIQFGGPGAELVQTAVSRPAASRPAGSRTCGSNPRLLLISRVFDFEPAGDSADLMPHGGCPHAGNFRGGGDLRIDVGLGAGESAQRAF
jgi:hypothetical protein